MLEDLMAEFGITHLRNTIPIARLVVKDAVLKLAPLASLCPTFLLLDEPLAGIDLSPYQRSEILSRS